MLTNPANPGYTKHISFTGHIDTRVNPKKLPTFPSLDYMPSDATALNDVVLTANSFRVNGTPSDSKELNALRYQTPVAALHGYRTPRETMKSVPRISKHVQDTPNPQLDTDVYYRVMASAEYGYRKLDNAVHERVQKGGKGSRGYSSFMRADGFERDENTSIHDQAPKGLTFDTEPAKPMIQILAPNHRKVAPVLAAARNF